MKRCNKCGNTYKQRNSRHKTCYICSSQLKGDRIKEVVGYNPEKEKFRFCSKCGDSYLDVPENWKRISKHINTGTCKTCEAEFQKAYYLANIELYRDRNRVNRLKRKRENDE